MLLGVIRRMCRREIPRTGKVTVGEGMVGRGQCLVREFQEVLEETSVGRVGVEVSGEGSR